MSGTSIVTVKHNFETAHRLPFLGGKCQNLHGHSWNVEVGLLNTAWPEGINEHGISVEYGLAKSTIRKWIDAHLDHGTMLGDSDSLIDHVEALGKVFIFGRHDVVYDFSYVIGTYKKLPWPTVEAVAIMLAEKLQRALEEACGPYIWVDSVRVEETAVNSSIYMPGTIATQEVEKPVAQDQ